MSHMPVSFCAEVRQSGNYTGREPLSDDEANQLQAACETFEEKSASWSLGREDLTASKVSSACCR
jgi:hypothetical protein